MKNRIIVQAGKRFAVIRTCALVLTIEVALSAIAGAQPPQADRSRRPRLMDRQEEIALALSACPASVATKAAVYVLDELGYVKVRDSQNGFTAIVQHSQPSSQEPRCMDAEGTRTHLPRILKVAELRALGKSNEEINRVVADSFAKGVFHTALYLLFNEGYHGASKESAVRAELCHEAMRLTAVLLEHPLGMTPATYALAALMCLNAARLPSRLDPAGNLNALVDQDRSKWDQKLVDEGMNSWIVPLAVRNSARTTSKRPSQRFTQMPSG